MLWLPHCVCVCVCVLILACTNALKVTTLCDYPTFQTGVPSGECPLSMCSSINRLHFWQSTWVVRLVGYVDCLRTLLILWKGRSFITIGQEVHASLLCSLLQPFVRSWHWVVHAHKSLSSERSSTDICSRPFSHSPPSEGSSSKRRKKEESPD